jgi:hypothetical protein
MTSAYPDLVTPEQLQARLQRPSPFSGAELARVQGVCEDASVLVRFESGNNWLDPDDPTQTKAPEIVYLIARRCAERAVRNPSNTSAESAADYSYQRNGTVGEGSLFLTDREIADLKQANGTLNGALWTQGTYRGDVWDHCGLFLNDQYGCDPILYGDGPGDWNGPYGYFGSL